MEANAGGHVEFEIGVMHPVQPPQHRHGVEEHVLEVDGEVKQDHRRRDRKPGRRFECLEKSPAAGLDEQRRADGGGRVYKAARPRY